MFPLYHVEVVPGHFTSFAGADKRAPVWCQVLVAYANLVHAQPQEAEGVLSDTMRQPGAKVKQGYSDTLNNFTNKSFYNSSQKSYTRNSTSLAKVTLYKTSYYQPLAAWS